LGRFTNTRLRLQPNPQKARPWAWLILRVLSLSWFRSIHKFYLYAGTRKKGKVAYQKSQRGYISLFVEEFPHCSLRSA